MHEGEAQRLARLRPEPAAADPRPNRRDAPAGLRRVEAGEDLDERRLARTIAAEQPVHLAAAHGEIDIVERERPAEALGELFDNQRSSRGEARMRSAGPVVT